MAILKKCMHCSVVEATSDVPAHILSQMKVKFFGLTIYTRETQSYFKKDLMEVNGELPEMGFGRPVGFGRG